MMSLLTAAHIRFCSPRHNVERYSPCWWMRILCSMNKHHVSWRVWTDGSGMWQQQLYLWESDVYEASPDGWAVWGVVVSTRWWLLVDHCVLRNWDRILVSAVKGLIYLAGMVSICPLLLQRDVTLQQTKPMYMKTETLAGTSMMNMKENSEPNDNKEEDQ